MECKQKAHCTVVQLSGLIQAAVDDLPGSFDSVHIVSPTIVSVWLDTCGKNSFEICVAEVCCIVDDGTGIRAQAKSFIRLLSTRYGAADGLRKQAIARTLGVNCPIQGL